MIQYLDLLRHVLEHGKFKADRTGTGTFSVFGAQIRCPLRDSFPLLTTKKVHTKSIIYELLWFLKGVGDTSFLQDNKVTIWDEWADERYKNNLGPVYGKQWRHWTGNSYHPIDDPNANHPALFDLDAFNKDANVKPSGRSNYGIDQIANVIADIKKNPDSRRLIVSAWNVVDIDIMQLPPCHCLFQFYVSEGELSCQLYQRSADIFLGVPYFCHIADCYHAVLINIYKGSMPLGVMIALSLLFERDFPAWPDGGGSRHSGVFGQLCFDGASNFCCN